MRYRRDTDFQKEKQIWNSLVHEVPVRDEKWLVFADLLEEHGQRRLARRIRAVSRFSARFSRSRGRVRRTYGERRFIFGRMYEPNAYLEWWINEYHQLRRVLEERYKKDA